MCVCVCVCKKLGCIGGLVCCRQQIILPVFNKTCTILQEAEHFFETGSSYKSLGLDANGKFNILLFWGRVENTFPHLSCTARAAYSEQATEANAERAFSSAGITLSDLRTSLGAEVMQMAMYIERNQAFIPSVDEIRKEYSATETEDAQCNIRRKGKSPQQ